MARASLTEQEWEVFLGLADRLGIDARGLQADRVRFSVLESVGHQLGRAVAQMATEKFTLLAAERITAPQACPTCRRHCPVHYEERCLETIDGPIDLKEPVCHCSVCRRDFFPSASSIRLGSTEL